MGYIFDGGNIGGNKGGSSSIADAPADGKIYGRRNGEWVEIPAGVPGTYEPGASIFGTTYGAPAEPLYPGATFAASSIYPAAIVDGNNWSVTSMTIEGLGGGGTWELKGYIASTADALHPTTLFTRIDNVILMGELNTKSAASVVRNPQYVAADSDAINCEVCWRKKWHPFTASPKDVTPWGRLIYERAVAGEYGPIEPWQDPV